MPKENDKNAEPRDESPKNEEQAPAAQPAQMFSETLAAIGSIKPRPIVTEMEESYLDYAMSVIVSRALPDARDGLKPVHRRILYSMHELGLRSTAKFRKSALVVGDVLGKYHPHGDSAVYDALVRMAQDFSMRYPLVRGQGNFGSLDGDSAAAMRYTEVKMERICDDMLQDIEKNTVDFVSNYDDSRKEPSVLPAKVPSLLLNGTVGIAVGMATNIPPHNLGELCDAILHIIEQPDSTVEDLLKYIKGPDFPTGGIVYDKEVLKQAYLTGRGSVVVRGVAEIEETKGGRFHIRISEIPYQVNKSTLIERIAKLVTDKVVQGVSDVRDESDRDGVRIIIELKRESYPQKVLNLLFKHTDLQTSFGYNMIALADGLQPRLLNLAEILQIYLKHRREVTVRRVTFDRDRAKERVHILEGLSIALNDIDKVVETIKKSPTKEEAQVNLVKKFKLTAIQADAILQMRLQTLAGLERKKIEDELKEKRAFIAECEAILKDKKRVDKIIAQELTALKTTYGDKRRTMVVPHAVGQFSAKDTIPNAPMIVALTDAGYVKRLSPMQFRAQHRGGKGIKGMTTKDDDEILSMLHVMNHDDLLFFTNTGRVFQLPVYELPQGSRIAKGQAIVNLLQLKPEEQITAILKADLSDKKFLFLVTKHGTVKRTGTDQFDNIRRSGLIAQKVSEGDELKWVVATTGANELLLVTRKGKAIRFREEDVRSMGRSAAGVRGIRLAQGDEVVEAAVITDPKTSKLLVVMENGLGKMTPVEQYRFQGRGGSGVKAAQLTAKTGDIVGGCVLADGDEGDLICISKQGQTIRMRLSDIPSLGRATQGVIVMRLNAKDKVASMSVIMEGQNGAVEGEDDAEQQEGFLEEEQEPEQEKVVPAKKPRAAAKK
ncbi:MAG: DNA gyrase subunit A [Candidatus Peribacteraceae bacterium]|nr:DNA gyrase subunit A [Candidatus Peribacteraceae bacterium]